MNVAVPGSSRRLVEEFSVSVTVTISATTSLTVIVVDDAPSGMFTVLEVVADPVRVIVAL